MTLCNAFGDPYPYSPYPTQRFLQGNNRYLKNLCLFNNDHLL